MDKAFIDTSAILRLLIKDDDVKMNSVAKLIRESKDRGVSLYLLPVAVMEIVFVLEKVYKIKKKSIKELVTAILNTPEIRVESEDIFRRAIEVYVSKNIKFADAVMSYWGLERGMSVVYTYDEKDFRRIAGLTVKKP